MCMDLTHIEIQAGKFCCGSVTTLSYSSNGHGKFSIKIHTLFLRLYVSTF